jgi:lipopolysaccharide export system protein LptA
VEDASDEGVVLKDGKPHRVMKIVYKEKGSFINAEGRKVEVEQPRVEYILVPEKGD